MRDGANLALEEAPAAVEPTGGLPASVDLPVAVGGPRPFASMRSRRIANFDRIIADVSHCESKGDLSTLVNWLVSSLGIPYFAVYFFPEGRGIDGSGNPIYLTNYEPEWVARYCGEHLIRLDPVLRRGVSRIGPMFWAAEDGFEDLSDAEKSVLQRARAYGLVRGMAAPFNGRGGAFGITTFVTSGSAKHFNSVVRRRVSELYLFASALFQRVVDLEVGAHGGAAAGLGEREIVALTWAARGRSAKETAVILEVPERQIVHCHNRAKRKLGALSLTEAVAKAVKGGIISI